MAYYRTKKTTAFEINPDIRRHANQVIMSGADEKVLVEKGFFMLEYIEVATGTSVTLEDGNGVVIADGVGNFSQEHSPLKCEAGLQITGTVIIAKGFVVEGVTL